MKRAPTGNSNTLTSSPSLQPFGGFHYMTQASSSVMRPKAAVDLQGCLNDAACLIFSGSTLCLSGTGYVDDVTRSYTQESGTQCANVLRVSTTLPQGITLFKNSC